MYVSMLGPRLCIYCKLTGTHKQIQTVRETGDEDEREWGKRESEEGREREERVREQERERCISIPFVVFF